MDGTLVKLMYAYKWDILDLLDPNNTASNINFWKETHENDPWELINVREQNAKAIKDIFLWANAAPSNLRYGDASSNSAIHENFDPMGNDNGTLTRKESDMMKNYVINYKTTKIGQQYYLRSSTGLHQKKTIASTKWYVKCIQNNEKCF